MLRHEGRRLGFTREIDDRLLAPVGVRLVALEKVVFGFARTFERRAIG